MHCATIKILFIIFTFLCTFLIYKLTPCIINTQPESKWGIKKQISQRGINYGQVKCVKISLFNLLHWEHLGLCSTYDMIVFLFYKLTPCIINTKPESKWGIRKQISQRDINYGQVKCVKISLFNLLHWENLRLCSTYDMIVFLFYKLTLCIINTQPESKWGIRKQISKRDINYGQVKCVKISLFNLLHWEQPRLCSIYDMIVLRHCIHPTV